jgi:succinoglycan biosynthesis protein ExoA
MSTSEVLQVAVLIPARNEMSSIRQCLDHVLAQDLPNGRLEVVLVDGDSTDSTAEVAEGVLAEAGLGRWQIYRNPDASTPSNLNSGLALVRAPVVCRVDARSLIPPDYVRRCLEILEMHPDVAVVGGSQVAIARSSAPGDVGIARALNNRYGMGLSRYRRGARSGPTDTVYLGAFRTAQLRGAGGWDERFPTNQDFELNRRMGAHGLVWFEDGLEVGYLPRQTFGELLRQYRRFGLWKARYWQMTNDRPQPRQLALLTGPPAVGLMLAAALRRRPVMTMAAVAVAVFTVESIGSRQPAADPPAARLAGVAALAAVAAGWWSGAVEGLLFRRPQDRRVSSSG